MKMPRWLTDKHAALLALHHRQPLRSRSVYSIMQSLGWDGTYAHARKTLSTYRKLFVVGTHGWRLTALGHAHQCALVHGMQQAVMLHEGRDRVLLDKPATNV